jgi:signal transduction histidine kinase
MPELPLSTTNARSASVPRHGRMSEGADVVSDLRFRLLRISLLPAIAMAVLAAAAATLLSVDLAAWTKYPAIAVVVAAGVAILIAVVSRAHSTAVEIHQQIEDSAQDMQESIATLRSFAAYGQEEIQRLVKQVRAGEQPAPRTPPDEPAAPGSAAPGNSPVADLSRDLQQAQYAAEVAVVQAAHVAFGGGADQRVAVFVNLGRRLQSLIHRAIQKLDELEHQVEDPDLLKGLFFVDHLATGVRRQAESLAMLGGAVSRRQWSNPVSMYTVLRSAVAEVEQYARVKVVQPIDGTLRGHAVADVIHLVAELIENATTFSAPETQVTLRAQSVAAGLAIDIQDRGLGMPMEEQQRMNDLLASPGKIDIGELLKDGRIGLYVVAELARRHGIAARLQTNIYGGTDAVVVLPQRLLGDGEQDQEPNQPSRPASQDAVTAGATAVQAAAPSTAPRPAFSPLSSGVLLPTASTGNGDGHGEVSSEHRLQRRLAGDPAPSSSRPDPARERHQAPSSESLAPTSAHAPTGAPPGNDRRPPLPKRRERTHLVPELLDGPTTTRNEPAAVHDPGLMAAFQKGIGRSTDEDDGPFGRTNHTS